MASRKSTFANIPNNTASQWWKDPGLRINMMHCIGLCVCPYYLGYDSALLTGLQALPQWNAYFGSPTGTKLGLITACLSFPSILSSFFSDIIAEKFGRRVALWSGTGLIVVGAFVNAFAQSLGMYIGGRIILGWGGGMTKVVAPALLQETAHPRLRPIASAIYYALYYSGSVLAAWITFGTLHMTGSEWSWRLPSLLQIIGPIIVFSLTATMPESPRWLVKNGHRDKALATLAKYHANGTTDDPLVVYEFSEICNAIEIEEQTKRVSYTDFVRSKANRHRLLIIITISLGQNWIGNGIISYYLSPILKTVGITDPAQVAGINGGLQIFNLFFAVGGALNVERVGRRPLWLISTFGMLISNCIIMGLSSGFASTGMKSVGTAVVPFLFIFYGFYDIAWTPLAYSYSSEILPYNMRTKGLALFVASQNIGQAFNQFVNPIALAAIAWRYYGVYIVIQVAYLILIWFKFPETRHRTIEEVSMLLDDIAKPDDHGNDLHTRALEAMDRKDGQAEHLEDVMRKD